MKYGTVGVTTLILTTALYACTHLPTGISQSPPPGQNRNGAGFRVAGTRPSDVKAIIGQPLGTRAFALTTKTPMGIQVIAHGLRNPWALAFLPSGQIFVTEKPGAMRIVTRAGTISDPIEGVPQVASGGDAGLLDVILDPGFYSNRLLYFTYVEPRDGGRGVAVAKARLSEDLKRLENLKVLIHVEPAVEPTAHYGSRMLFDKQGKILVTMGERFFDPMRGQAQNLNSLMGKILRINTDGTPAPDNPFAHTPGALPEIWSYGMRNPQGMTFHPQTGELWELEPGPRGGDEVNVIQPGKNYGWPITSYGTDNPGMEQPIYYWDPAIAPSGATFYSGSLIPEWKNNLFVAGLAGEHLVRLVLKGHTVIGEERLLLDQHQRMRDVQQGPDGALWVVTDNIDGRLLRIAPKTSRFPAPNEPVF